MNNNLKLTARIFFSACILFVLSCNKIIDFGDLLNHHNNDKLCQISKIISFSSPLYDTVPSTAQFSYNKNGDPVSVTFNRVTTGRPNLIFRYDKYGRLTDYAGIYTPPAGYEFWHHYQYQHNRIVSDTLNLFGWFSGDTLYPDPNLFITEQYQYDNFGRISQLTQEFATAPPGVPNNVINYSYNNSGNLDNGLTYDNKVNIHRTSDVWMFVDADYSINNPQKATRYNGAGLPLGFDLPKNSLLPFLYEFDIGKSTIEYNCK